MTIERGNIKNGITYIEFSEVAKLLHPYHEIMFEFGVVNPWNSSDWISSESSLLSEI